MSFKDEEVVKVVRALCGDTTPLAETYHDAKVFDNITLTLNVVDTLICGIGNNVINNYMADMHYGSVDKCIDRAYAMLKTIKAHIEDYEELVQERENG